MPDPCTTERIAPGIRTPAGFTRATGEIRALLAGLEAAGLSPAALAAALLTEAVPRLVAAHGLDRCADLFGTLSIELRLDAAAAGPVRPRLAS